MERKKGYLTLCQKMQIVKPNNVPLNSQRRLACAVDDCYDCGFHYIRQPGPWRRIRLTFGGLTRFPTPGRRQIDLLRRDRSERRDWGGTRPASNQLRQKRRLDFVRDIQR